MLKRVVKSLLFGAFLGVLLFAGLMFNIVTHEAGHWAVAESMDLSPKIHLFESYTNGTVSLFTPNFFTTYKTNNQAKTDAEIALAGPAINAFITLCLVAAYFAIPESKRTFKLGMIFTVLVLTALVSAVANMLPVPGTDGSRIWSYLLG